MYVADTLSRAYLTVAQATSCPDHVLAVTDDAEDQETINRIAVSDRKAEIKRTTCADPELTTLKKAIKQEWPYTPDSLPDLVKPYNNFRDELAVADQLVVKGERLLVLYGVPPVGHCQTAPWPRGCTSMHTTCQKRCLARRTRDVLATHVEGDSEVRKAL